jgi:hypothetical protein
MKLTSKQVGILVTSLVTAVLHLLAAFDRALFPAGPDPLFILNGVGYLGLLGAYVLPIRLFQQRHTWVRWILIGYAILTILAWIWIYVIQFVVLGGTPFFSRDAAYGIPAKIAEALLIAFLWTDK